MTEELISGIQKVAFETIIEAYVSLEGTRILDVGAGSGFLPGLCPDGGGM